MARMTATVQRRPSGLREFLGLNPGPGETPSGLALNDYLSNMEPTFEQARQGQALQDQRDLGNRVLEEESRNNDLLSGAAGERFSALWKMLQPQREYEMQKLILPAQIHAYGQLGVRQAGEQAAMDRTRYVQQQMTARAGEGEAGREARSRRAIAEQRARMIETGKAPVPEGGFWSGLRGIFSSGPRIEAANKIRAQALQAPEPAQMSKAQQDARDASQLYPGLSLEDLINRGLLVDLTPQELPEYEAAFSQQGRR